MNIETLREKVQLRDWETLRPYLHSLAVQDVADILGELDPDDWVLVLKLLDSESSPQVFAYLSASQQAQILGDLLPDERRALLIQQTPDDLVALIETLLPHQSDELLQLLPDDLNSLLKNLLACPPDSAGRLMTPYFARIDVAWTVAKALEHVRQVRAQGHSETLDVIIAVNEHGQLQGLIDLRRLLLGQQDAPVASLLPRDPALSVAVDWDRERVATLMQDYDLTVVPVVESTGKVLGIVTIDDVLDVVEEETTEDFQRLAGIMPFETRVSEASGGLLYRKRIGWLLILVVVNLFSGAALAIYEDAIEAVVALVFFLPLVIASSGNTGMQASTLIVRAMATGDVQLRDLFGLLGKELFVVLGLGLTMGIAVAGVGYFWGGIPLAMTVAIAMVLVVINGGLIGLLLPFILSRFRLDPATASAPLITSVADITGILIYFAVAVTVFDFSANGLA